MRIVITLPHKRCSAMESYPFSRGVKRERPDIDVRDGVKWSPIVLSRGNLNVQGGFNKRRKEKIQVRTGEFELTGEKSTMTMFHISKTEPWFGKLVSGYHSMGRGGENIKLIDMLRDKIKEKFGVHDGPPSVSIDDSAQAGDKSSAIADAPHASDLSTDIDPDDPLSSITALAVAAEADKKRAEQEKKKAAKNAELF